MTNKSIVMMVLFVFLGSMGFVQAEHTATKTGTAPGSFKVSDPVSGEWLLTVGATVCQNVSTSIGAHCASAGAGGVIFDISDLGLKPHQGGNKAFDVVQGNLTATVLTCNPCGLLNITICTDRDDDTFCTNADPVESDGHDGHPKNCANNKTDEKDDHWTSCFFDDMWAEGELNKPKSPGDSIRIPFCFAHDSILDGGWDWDTWAVFLATDPLNPNSGTVQLTLHDVEKVGDKTTSCSKEAFDNTVGTYKRP